MSLPTHANRGGTVDSFNVVHRDFDDLLNRLFNGETGAPVAGLVSYPVDVREDADHFYVDAELPGFKKDEIDITLENSTLTIAAERSAEAKAEAAPATDILLNERRYRRFRRSFKLPPTVDGGNVEAKLEEGILHLVLKKREETKPRKITVS